MVRINLLSERERKKSKDRHSPIGMPSIPRLPSATFVSSPLLAGVLLFLVLAGAVYMYIGQGRQIDSLEERIDLARQDSTRYSRAIAKIREIESTQSAIVQRIQAIQSVDQGRFRWPHVLQEVSRSLPENTWLTSVTKGDDVTGPDAIEITGVTFSNLTLTQFMLDLESSPYLERVSLIGSTRSSVQGTDVTSFALLAAYIQPPAS